MNAPNPNGANQYSLDPRQLRCWGYYVSPSSPTFGNARRSAITAGYEPDYADQITSSEWFKEKLRRLNMLQKAEKALDEMLELINVDAEGKIDPALTKIKQDTAKFLAERLGKADGYSTRVEATGADGAELPTPIINVFRNNSVQEDSSAQ